MILDNWWIYKKAISDYSIQWSSWNIITPGLIDTNGNSCSIVLDAPWQANYCSMAHNNYASRGEISFTLGSGTIAPTKTDYNLENDITSSFSNVTFTKSSVESSDDLAITYVITGTNNSANTLTISEIGYLKNIYYQASFNTDPVMMAREVLNEPLIVEPNQSFTINFVWTER